MENELFEKAPVPKAYFTMALPVVMGMVVSLIYNMVDTFFIARTQNTDLVAGVSLCAPIFTLMIALGDIFGLGGSSVISRLFGEKREEEGKRVSGFCFYAAILCGVAVTLLMLFLQMPILRLLGATEDTMEYARQYYRYMAYGAPFIIVSLTPSNLIRTCRTVDDRDSHRIHCEYYSGSGLYLWFWDGCGRSGDRYGAWKCGYRYFAHLFCENKEP